MSISYAFAAPCQSHSWGFGSGGFVFTAYRPIPTIQPLPLATDELFEFRLLGPRLEHPHPSPALTYSVGVVPAYNTVDGTLTSPENTVVDTGAFTSSAARPLVVSPSSTTDATIPPPSNLGSSRTRQRTDRAAGSPRATINHGIGRPTTAYIFQTFYIHPPRVIVTNHGPTEAPPQTASNRIPRAAPRTTPTPSQTRPAPSTTASPPRRSRSWSSSSKPTASLTSSPASSVSHAVTGSENKAPITCALPPLPCCP